MTDEPTNDPAAQAITDAILAIPEVRGLFPHSIVAAAVGILIGSSSSPATSLVEINRTTDQVAVSARLAVATSASSTAIAIAARQAINEVLGSAPNVALHVQIAHID